MSYARKVSATPYLSMDTSTILYTGAGSRGPMYRKVMERVAGDIVLSRNPAKAIRKWREEFNISQNVLAREMNVSQSVISDYESGRRKSPGAHVIRKIVEGLIAADERSGGRKLRDLGLTEMPDGVISSREIRDGVHASRLMKMLRAKNLTPSLSLLRDVYGCTIIDSLTAITSLTFYDYYKIYGSTSARALMFTNVRSGRSPMVAVRVYPLKPAMVIYIQPEGVDHLAVRLAEIDDVILCTSDLKLNEIVKRMNALG